MSESCCAHEPASPWRAEWIARSLFAGLAAWLLALVSTSPRALTLAEYEHTSWGVKEGVAGAVTRAREAPNGMLLLRTSIGYQVFDGVEIHSFERGKPPPLVDYASALGQRSRRGSKRG